MVCLRNMCVDTLHKGDNDDDNNYNKWQNSIYEGSRLTDFCCTILDYFLMIQLVERFLSLEVKWSGREADHSPQSSIEVGNECNYTSIPVHAFMAYSAKRLTFYNLVTSMTSIYISFTAWISNVSFSRHSINLDMHAGQEIMSASLHFLRLEHSTENLTESKVLCKNSNSIRQDIKNSTKVCPSCELQPTGVWHTVVIQLSLSLVASPSPSPPINGTLHPRTPTVATHSWKPVHIKLLERTMVHTA